MKMRVLVTPAQLAITCAFVLTACLLCQDRGGTPPVYGGMQVGGIFTKADASGSLEYWGSCPVKDFYSDFPKLKKISGNKDSVLESLREMFSVDPKMRVNQDADGKIRMIEEDVPDDLLKVKIHDLRFPAEYHGPDAAIVAILETSEVTTFRREHNIGTLGDVGAGLPSEAYAPDKPRVYGHLHDVTVKQALDYILQTFHGFWLYENCKVPGDSRIVYFAFFENAPSAAPALTQK